MEEIRVSEDVKAFATLSMHSVGQSETQATTIAVVELQTPGEDVTVFMGRDLKTGERVELTLEYFTEEG
jgi:uncharacterized OB-fold protein